MQRLTTVARHIVRSVALILPLVALTGSVGSTKDNVEIRLTGRFFAEPATVQLVVAVEPDAANRTLRVEADGDNMFCATEISACTRWSSRTSQPAVTRCAPR
jgi:hypothetical protein